MKKVICYIFAIVLCMTSCKEKTYEIYTVPPFDQCLAPTDVKAKVLYMNVTFDWRAYGDAEYYCLEIYTPVPADGEEPDPSTLIDRFEVKPDMLPFNYRAPEDVKCFYRIKGVREARKDSRWTTGTFVTDVDPSTTCTTPTSVKALAICDMVVFTWDVYPNSSVYELEVYSSSIPSEGSPDEDALVRKLEIDPIHVPDTVMFEPYMRYYYRVRGAAPGSELKPSKWVRGSFETSLFEWPEDPNALNTKTTQDYSGTCDDGSPSPFSGTGATQKEGTVITLNGFTYAYKCMYYGNRVTLPTGLVTDLNSDYGASIPTKDYVSFKICKPGRLEGYFTAAAAAAEACVVLMTNKEGEGKVARVVYKRTDLPVTATTGGLEKDVVRIKEGDLYGIKEAATVYMFSSNRKGLHVFKMTWIPE